MSRTRSTADADTTDVTAQLLDVARGLQGVVYALMNQGAGEGRAEGRKAFSGPNATSVKHLAQSVKDGRLVTFLPVDMDEITGYVTGWDDLRQPHPRVFVVTPPSTREPLKRWLVPFYNTIVRLHDNSTAPRDASDPFYESYEEIVRPFKTLVLDQYFGQQKSQNKGGATPGRRAAN